LLTRVESVRLIDIDYPPPVWDPGHVPITIPVSVLIGVGHFVATATPIPPAWDGALDTVTSVPDDTVRSEATDGGENRQPI